MSERAEIQQQKFKIHIAESQQTLLTNSRMGVEQIAFIRESIGSNGVLKKHFGEQSIIGTSSFTDKGKEMIILSTGDGLARKEAFLVDDLVVLGPSRKEIRIHEGAFEMTEAQRRDIALQAAKLQEISPREVFKVISSPEMNEIREKARNDDVTLQSIQIQAVGREKGEVVQSILSFEMEVPSFTLDNGRRQLNQIVDIRLQRDERVVNTHTQGGKKFVEVDMNSGDPRLPQSDKTASDALVVYPSWGGTTERVVFSQGDSQIHESQGDRYVRATDVLRDTQDMATAAAIAKELGTNELRDIMIAIMQRRERELFDNLTEKSQSLNWVILAAEQNAPSNTPEFLPLQRVFTEVKGQIPTAVGMVIPWTFTVGRNDQPLFAFLNHVIVPKTENQKKSYVLQEVSPRLIRGDVVGILPVFSDGNRTVGIGVDEYRGALGGKGIQTPAGVIEKGEAFPKDRATQELLEELGGSTRFRREELLRIGQFLTTPRVGPERATLYTSYMQISHDRFVNLMDRFNQAVGGAAHENEETKPVPVSIGSFPEGPKDLKWMLLDNLTRVGAVEKLANLEIAIQGMETYMAVKHFPEPELLAVMVVNKAFGIPSLITPEMLAEKGVDISAFMHEENLLLERAPATIIGSIHHRLWQRDFKITNPGKKNRWKDTDSEKDKDYIKLAYTYKERYGKFPGSVDEKKNEDGSIAINEDGSTTLRVDIYNMDFGEMPPSRQEESIHSGFDALKILAIAKEKGFSNTDFEHWRSMLSQVIFGSNRYDDARYDLDAEYENVFMSSQNSAPLTEELHAFGAYIHEEWLKRPVNKNAQNYLTRNSYDVMRAVAEKRFSDIDPSVLSEIIHGVPGEVKGAIETTDFMDKVYAKYPEHDMLEEQVVIDTVIQEVLASQAKGYLLSNLANLAIPLQLASLGKGMVLEDLKHIFGGLEVLHYQDDLANILTSNTQP